MPFNGSRLIPEGCWGNEREHPPRLEVTNFHFWQVNYFFPQKLTENISRWPDLAHRIQYLRQLVISFSQARDIEKTLLVFSHDFWDPEINDLVASIDFAKTLQIFYPFSIQTHQNTFPGESKNDCPRNAKKHEWVNKAVHCHSLKVSEPNFRYMIDAT